MKSLIEKLRSGIDLQTAISVTLWCFCSRTKLPTKTKAEFLTALHQKGESAEEIVGFVRALMERALDPMIDPSDLPGPMIDVCGTGGAGLHFFNVSTTIMFVLAAGGVVVLKHGARKVTSLCGSADVLEELGIPIRLKPEELKECAKRLGLGFIFAPQYHPAFGVIAQMRERLARAKMRSIFNLLGPLLNPAPLRRQLIGVFCAAFPAGVGGSAATTGAGTSVGGSWTNRRRYWNGQHFSLWPNHHCELHDGKITSAVLDAHWLGIGRSSLADLRVAAGRKTRPSCKGFWPVK